jgi:hypothetical protein
MDVEDGPQLAVICPFSTTRLSLNLAPVEPMQIAEISASSASQVVGQPLAEHDDEVTVRNAGGGGGAGATGVAATAGSISTARVPARSLTASAATRATEQSRIIDEERILPPYQFGLHDIGLSEAS